MTLSINNVQIVDGSGSAPYEGCLFIRDDKIEEILPGRTEAVPADTVIDGLGRVCTPGFIDIHRHADYALFQNDFGINELSQGLTTVINGNCGMSGAPVMKESEVSVYQEPVMGKAAPEVGTKDIRSYIASVRAAKPVLNSGMLAGLGTIAAGVNGVYEPFNKDSLPGIRKGLEQALREGAVGVSLGIGYNPLYTYSADEIAACLEPVRDSDIPVTVHMRQEGDGMTDALKESISVAKALRAPMEISHLKSIGKRNWQKTMPEALAILHEAKEDGVRVGWDMYPYTAGSTQLMHVLPPEFCGREAEALKDVSLYKEAEKRIAEGTDFENAIRLCGYENIFPGHLCDGMFSGFDGLSLKDGAEKAGMEPLRWLLTILSREKSPSMIDFITCEEDLAAALRDGETAVISDSIYPADGSYHPRVAGTYSRIIERYVLGYGVLSLQEAVRRMTSLPARRMRIKDRGLLQKNYKADICVFDPCRIRERSEYGKKLQPSEGMEYVIVNGEIALHNGELKSGHAGKCI